MEAPIECPRIVNLSKRRNSRTWRSAIAHVLSSYGVPAFKFSYDINLFKHFSQKVTYRMEHGMKIHGQEGQWLRCKIDQVVGVSVDPMFPHCPCTHAWLWFGWNFHSMIPKPWLLCTHRAQGSSSLWNWKAWCKLVDQWVRCYVTLAESLLCSKGRETKSCSHVRRLWSVWRCGGDEGRISTELLLANNGVRDSCEWKGR